MAGSPRRAAHGGVLAHRCLDRDAVDRVSGVHGAAYDAATDRWTALPDGLANRDAQAVWTGREIVVFGGSTAQTYDPQTRTWHGQSSTPPSITSARVNHRMVWTGTEVVVFGGRTGNDLLADGAAWRRTG